MASGRPLLPLSPPTPSPSPSPHPTDTNNSDVPRSSSKKVTISSESRNATKSSDTFSFNPQLRSSSKSSASIEALPRSGSTRPPPPARYSSRRSDSSRFGSQRDIPDEEARFVYTNDPERTNLPPVQFPDNSIKTTKYTVITFLPRNLFEQFHRVAYVYFLVLVALNQVPQLGVFSPAASVLPLAFVLGVTAVKDGYEDWRRHRSDRIENNRTASVLVGSEFQPRPWKSVRVGELIRVGSNETLPCDLVVLSTSDPTGVAYVQTINLDGESNLKTRYAKQETQLIPPNRVSCLIRCEKPNRNIYGFHATVDVDGKRVSLGPANIILRGCELKNTNWVIGVAVYTGKETKVMLNSSGAPSKRSRLETHMNREIILLAVALFTVCTIVTVLAGLWLHRHEDQLDTLPYYRKKDFSGKEIGKYDYYGIGWQITFTFFMSVIQFQVMIPIALYISMELVRLAQAFFMIQDKDMYHEATDSRFQCRALNINEDLGQIKYVFSDKTGTLTENKMEFQCASIRGVDYSGIGEEKDGGSVSVDGQVWKPKLKVKPDPDLLHLLKHGGGTEKGDRARDFFLALAACNTIVPIIADTSDPSQKLIDYQGESPDEQALVYAAAAYGFMLIERTSGHIVIDVHGQRQRFNALSWAPELTKMRHRTRVIIAREIRISNFNKKSDSLLKPDSLVM